MGNLHRNLAFRDRVLLYLHLAGFSSLTSPEIKRGLTLMERVEQDTGDILGLPWTLGVRNQVNLDMASAMHQVESEAENAGTELFASIQHCRKGSTGDAYVTMRLSVFVKVLQRLHPELTDNGTSATSGEKGAS